MWQLLQPVASLCENSKPVQMCWSAGETCIFFGYWRDFIPPTEYANCIQKGPSWNQTRNLHARRILWTAGPLLCIIQSPDRKCVCQLDDITQPYSCSITVICMKAWAPTDVRSGREFREYVPPVSAFALMSSCKIFNSQVCLSSRRPAGRLHWLQSKSSWYYDKFCLRPERRVSWKQKDVFFFKRDPSIRWIFFHRWRLVLTWDCGERTFNNDFHTSSAAMSVRLGHRTESSNWIMLSLMVKASHRVL